MNDPTLSRYRFLDIKSNKNYGRFNSIANKNLDRTNVITKVSIIPAHGTYGELLFKPEWRKEILQLLRWLKN